MILEDAFDGVLTSTVKGLKPMIDSIVQLTKEVKELTEAGKIPPLKKKLVELDTAAQSLKRLTQNSLTKISELTTTETGAILDLSLPPEKRK